MPESYSAATLSRHEATKKNGLKNRVRAPSHLDAVRARAEGVSLVPGWKSFRAESGLSVLLLAFACSVGTPARAAERFERTAAELANNSDFRVRTQAALALGASKDKRAVKILCGALEDANTTVRAAAAAALGKLQLGGADCLKERLQMETAASVKSVLEKSLDKVKASQKPAVTQGTKYYVAVAATTDKSGRTGTEVDDMVRGALEEAAASLEGTVVAPRDENQAQAKSLLAKHKQVKSFYLWPKVMPPAYNGGKLTVRFEIAVFTYPSKSLKGTIPLKLTMPGVDETDKSAEDDLIKQAAASGFEKFKQNIDRLQ